jgi:hypothetical protein
MVDRNCLEYVHWRALILTELNFRVIFPENNLSCQAVADAELTDYPLLRYPVQTNFICIFFWLSHIKIECYVQGLVSAKGAFLSSARMVHTHMYIHE